MSDYTLIASNQHGCCLLCLGRNDLAFFDSDFAVNYVTFGSDHEKLVGSLNGGHDVAATLCSECPFCMCQLIHFWQLLSNPASIPAMPQIHPIG